MSDSKKAATIGKLLEMAERGATAEEREAFSRQAERLMIKYGIEEAMARAASGGHVKPEEVVTVPMDFGYVGTTYSKGVVLLGYDIAVGLGINAFQSGWRTLWLVGHESDVERAQTLIASLVLQEKASETEWYNSVKGDLRHLTAHEKWRLKMDFMVSFGSAVKARLREMNREETEAVPGAALVLRDRKKEIAEVMEARNLKTGRGHTFGGSAAGAAAGRRANLGEKAVAGRKTLG